MSSEPLDAFVPGMPSSSPSLDYEDAFAYLFRRPGGWKALILGGILLLFSWLILPLLVVIGYGAALGRTVAAGDRELPAFQLGMAADGLRAVVIMIGYLVPIVLVYIVAVVPLIVAGETGNEPASGLVFFGSFGILFLLMLYGLGLAVLQPAIFAVFISEGSVGACFSPRRLKAVIKYWRGTYVGAAAIIFGISQLVGFGFILFIIGIAFAYFYFMAFTAHVSGQLARPLLQAIETPASTLVTG